MFGLLNSAKQKLEATLEAQQHPQQHPQPAQKPHRQQGQYQPQYQAQPQHQSQSQQQPQHQQQQHTWQYSQCTGKKKAVLIGVNYFGTKGELAGCINDVQNLREFLCTQWKYPAKNIVVLTDDQRAPRSRPTRANIIAAAQWLVADAAPNDALFFHFSGHGVSVKDTSGDEHDGHDEAICPEDYQTAGMLVDDELHALLVAPLPVGCRMTVLFDACHSGSALDLPYTYTTEGNVQSPALLAEAGRGLKGAYAAYSAGDMGGVLSNAKALFHTARGEGGAAHRETRRTRSSDADVIFFSGCKDEQTSADAVEGGEATGAMSFAFIAALSENPRLSYKELLVRVRAILQRKYSQKPQLSSSHEIDTDLEFVI